MSLIVLYRDTKKDRWIAGTDSSISSTSTVCQKLSKNSSKLRELKNDKGKIVGLFGMTGNISKIDVFYETMSNIINSVSNSRNKELSSKTKTLIINSLREEQDYSEEGYEIVLVYYDKLYLMSSSDGGLFEIEDNLFASGTSIDYALGYLQCAVDNNMIGDTIANHMLKMYQHLAEDGNYIKPPFIFYTYEYGSIKKGDRSNKNV